MGCVCPDNKPLTLIVKPTHECNMNCPYCYDSFNRREGKFSGRMSLEIVAQITKIFPNVGNWIWHGGEPLLMGVDFFTQANDIILNSKTAQSINVQTNGTLINQNFIDLFKKYKMQPGLSFDGINNQKTRRNTEVLLPVFSMLERNSIDFGCIMVLDSSNIHKIIAEYEYFKRLNIRVQMNLIYKANENPNSEVLESDSMYENICEFIDYWIVDQHSPEHSTLVMDYFGRILGGNRQMCSDMDCAGKWFAIHPSGELHPCGRDWDDRCSFGNIYDYTDYRQIYEHPNFTKFWLGTRRMLEKCSECPFFFCCGGGCYGTNFNYDPSFENPEPNHCIATKKIITHVFNILKDMSLYSDYSRYNPIFIKELMRLGLRNIDQIKEVI